MDKISKHQYKLLNKLHRKNLNKSKLKEKQIQNIYYLGKLNVVKYQTKYENNDSLKEIDTIFSISPEGEAFWD